MPTTILFNRRSSLGPSRTAGAMRGVPNSARSDPLVRNGGSAVFLSLFLALLVFTGIPAWGVTPFRIGTGGSKGVYYPIGRLIAEQVTRRARDEGSPLYGMIGVAQNSAGSVENIHAIVRGEIEAGLVQADIAALARSGAPPFSGTEKFSSIRALASLYPEYLQLVVRTDAGVTRFTDLRGKRISIDEPGSGTLAVMRLLLETHDMSETDIRPLYLKPIYTLDLLRSNKVHGFAIMAGAPIPAVTELLDTPVTLVSIEPSVLAAIHRRYPYLEPGSIPAGTYAGLPATATLKVYALLAVDARMADETAYAVVETLFEDTTLRRLHEEHPMVERISPDTALNGLSIPLHPGAERYYTEHGVSRSQHQ